jgi:hypothetical protein
MKRIILFIVSIIFLGNGYVQGSNNDNKDRDILSEFEEMKKDFSESENEWVFSRIVTVENKSKENIYIKALEVLAEIYNNSKDVIQSEDKEAGVIVGKGFMDSNIRTINWVSICRNRCWHLIKIEAKEGKYRITITVNSVWNETGADLRNSFDGTEYKLTDFYPYWKGCKPKRQSASFDNLKFVYDSSMSLMDNLEKGINKKLKSSDNW